MNIASIARFIPLVIGLTILIVGSLFVPWDKVVPYLRNISPTTVLLLFFCSAIYYFGRILRYWLMLRYLGEPVSFDKVALAVIIAQPVAVLPGGELYRIAMLKRYGNVSLKDGLPSVFAQSVAESVGLLIIALIGAAFLRRYVGILLIVATIMASLLLFIRLRKSHTGHAFINKLPFVNVSQKRFERFMDRNRELMTGMNFVTLVGAAYISIFGGIAALYITANTFGGSLNIFEAAISFAIPVMLESISFLPGGIGVNEQGSVAIQALFGIALPMAVAVTIAVRLTTLGSGFLYGLLAFLFARKAHYKEY